MKNIVYYSRFRKRIWTSEKGLIFKSDTYSARPGIRNPSIVLHPAMVRAFLVSIGAIKNCSDVSHAVHTDSRAFEDRAGRKQHHSILHWFIYWTLTEHRYDTCCRRNVGVKELMAT